MFFRPRNSLPRSLDRSDLFQPPWIFRNGHIQTLAGLYIYSPLANRPNSTSCASVVTEIPLDDGDRLVYHDDCPATWNSGDRVALLLHGLSGSHASPDMTRIARLLNQKNVRTARLDWRGCGAGVALARYSYHSGRSDDLLATIVDITTRCPGSPVCLIGVSLGGNVLLKLLGENSCAEQGLSAVDRAIAVCPPIDLHSTVTELGRGLTRLYDRYFCKACIRDVRHRQKMRPDAIIPDGWYSRLPQTLHEFDETFTAPVSGFASALDYYTQSSSKQFLASIKVPTLLIAAQDDPIVPFRQFQTADYSPWTKLMAPYHGGHVGFCTPWGLGWLDQRILEWVVQSPDACLS